MRHHFLPLNPEFFSIVLFRQYGTNPANNVNTRTFSTDNYSINLVKVIDKEESPLVIFHGNQRNSNQIQLEEYDHKDSKYVLPRIFFRDSLRDQSSDFEMQLAYTTGNSPKFNRDIIIQFTYDKHTKQPHMETSPIISDTIIQYITFSNDSQYQFTSISDPTSQPYVKITEKDYKYTATFYQPKSIWNKPEAINYVTHARNQCFIYFFYYKIPIIIKLPGARFELNYFQNVWQSAILQYPNSIKLLDPDLTIYYRLSTKTATRIPNLEKVENNPFPKIKFATPDVLPSPQQQNTSQFQQLPISLISKSIYHYPNVDILSRAEMKISRDSALFVYPHFSEHVMNISLIPNFEVKDIPVDANIISFLELGYTTMKQDKEFQFEPEKNIITAAASTYNTIMFIAGKLTGRLFFNSEPGAVQFAYRGNGPSSLVFYTRNRNSIMANANVIAAALRTSNVIVVPITISHLSSFIASLECAITNWKRFALSYPIVAQYTNRFIFVVSELPEYQYFSISSIKHHLQLAFSKYESLREIELSIVKQETLKNINETNSANITFTDTDNKTISFNDFSYKIPFDHIKYSISAFATVNDCADFLDLNDPLEDNFPNSIFD